MVGPRTTLVAAVTVACALACGGEPRVVVAPDLAAAVRVEREHYTVDVPGNWRPSNPFWAKPATDVLIQSPGGCDVIIVAGNAGLPPEQAITEWLEPPIAVEDAVSEPIDRWGALEGRGVVIRGIRLGEQSVQTRFATSDALIGIAAICPASALPLEQPGLDLVRDSFTRR